MIELQVRASTNGAPLFDSLARVWAGIQLTSPHTAKELAARLGVPPRLAQRCVARLVSAGLVTEIAGALTAVAPVSVIDRLNTLGNPESAIGNPQSPPLPGLEPPSPDVGIQEAVESAYLQLQKSPTVEIHRLTKDDLTQLAMTHPTHNFPLGVVGWLMFVDKGNPKPDYLTRLKRNPFAALKNHLDRCNPETGLVDAPDYTRRNAARANAGNTARTPAQTFWASLSVAARAPFMEEATLKATRVKGGAVTESDILRAAQAAAWNNQKKDE